MFRKPPVYLAGDKGQAAWNADVVQALRELQAIPFLRGFRINNVAITSTPTKFKHGLGRVPQGFWVINQSANTLVWQPFAPSKDDITLEATADIVTDIWVF